MARKKKENYFGLPEKIKIGYALYDIKTYTPKKDDTESDEATAMGLTFSQWHFIKLNEQQSIRECASTLVHELLHAIVYVFSIKFKTDQEEEKYVSALANGITTIFRDNPELLDWLKKSLMEGRQVVKRTKKAEETQSKTKKRKKTL